MTVKSGSENDDYRFKPIVCGNRTGGCGKRLHDKIRLIDGTLLSAQRGNLTGHFTSGGIGMGWADGIGRRTVTHVIEKDVPLVMCPYCGFDNKVEVVARRK